MQKHFLTEYLIPVKPFVSNCLIDTASWSNIEALTNYLPSQITNFALFECRLGIPNAGADFSLCIATAEAGQKILTDESIWNLPDSLWKEPVWSQIRNLATSWQHQDSPLHSNIDNIWLEFDVDESNLHQPPIPSCFFGSATIHATSSVTPSPYPYTWVTQTAIPLLRGHPLSPTLEQQLWRCVNELPTDACVSFVGLMLARQSDMVRITLAQISPEKIPQYLSNLGWSGEIDPLKDLLKDISAYTEVITLAIDVGETGVAAKIGLECFLNLQPKFEPRWISFLDYLVKVGLCLPQKRDALLAYPGYVREKKHRELIPSHLLKLSQFLGPNHENVFMRGLNHIKLVYQSDQAIEAKAYFWVRYFLLDKLVTLEVLNNDK